ncbi:hypothetical protein HYS94_02245 [Candidatus Daviesbacteria bacterium]|nr:hypothetical protein [Candidatus Daviesbacteria bacterium]
MQVEKVKIIENKSLVTKCDFCFEENQTMDKCDLCSKDFCWQHGKVYARKSYQITPTPIYTPNTTWAPLPTWQLTGGWFEKTDTCSGTSSVIINYFAEAIILKLCQECRKPEYDKILEIIIGRS